MTFSNLFIQLHLHFNLKFEKKSNNVCGKTTTSGLNFRENFEIFQSTKLNSHKVHAFTHTSN